MVDCFSTTQVLRRISLCWSISRGCSGTDRKAGSATVCTLLQLQCHCNLWRVFLED